MSEIKFLQSCPGLDIATHAPCAIDSGFESVDKLHHRWSWDARWLTPGRKRVGHAIHYNTQAKRADAARVRRFLAGIDRVGSGTLGEKQRPRRPPSHHCPIISQTGQTGSRTGTLSERAVGSSAVQTLTSLPHLQAAMPPWHLAGWSGRMAAKVSASVSPRSHPPGQNSRSPMLMFILILALALALVPSLSRHPRHTRTHTHTPDKPACRNIRTASTTLCRILSAIFRLTLQDAAQSELRWASATAPPSSGRLLQPFRPI